MKQIFNEFWISIVFWKWNWLGFSYEIEEWDKEIRWLGWKKIKIKDIKNIYFRLWIFNKVLIFSRKNWIKFKNKNKYWLKIILWFSN